MKKKKKIVPDGANLRQFLDLAYKLHIKSAYNLKIGFMWLSFASQCNDYSSLCLHSHINFFRKGKNPTLLVALCYR